MTYIARIILAVLAATVGALLLVTAAVIGARAEDHSEDVLPERWVVSVAIKDTDGEHKGPSWYFKTTFADADACAEFLASTEWSVAFREWALHEIMDHKGNVTIPTPRCVQRKDIKDYGSPA